MDYEHFAGTYASQATPFWPNFEIIHTDSGFIFKEAGGDTKITELMAKEGKLCGESFDHASTVLEHDSVENQYHLLFVTREDPEGTTEITIQLVKAQAHQSEKLEKEYGVKVADLVQDVYDSEEWIHQVKSFQVKAKDKWTKTPEGIEHRRKELKTQFPDMEISSRVFPGLRSHSEGELEVVFDDSRFRIYHHRKDESMLLDIWDGHEFIAHEKYFTHEQEHYGYQTNIPEIPLVFRDFQWPSAQNYKFWWNQSNVPGFTREKDIPKMDFILTGKQDYRGTPCYILECERGGHVKRWFIGIKGHLRYGCQTFNLGQMISERWTGDYKEVKPGWWFPMSQGHHVIYDQDQSIQSFIGSTRDIKIETIHINHALSDDLFMIDFKNGVKVCDCRFGGIVTYKYKEDRTEEEWAEIHQKAREYQEEDEALKRGLDQRVGQMAMEFPQECQWINTESLTMEQLRGKAIVFQFWNMGCGACHSYMKCLTTRTVSEKVVIIGIHTAEMDPEKIKADIDKYKANGPVCIDVGGNWGKITNWYGVKAVPYWIVVGPDGKVAGHSFSQGETVQLAHQLIAKESE